MENPLYISKSKKWKGLTVYCYKCKTNVNEICRDTGKPIQKCREGRRHKFKVYIHVPGTVNVRRTKKLDTRDVNEAIRQAIQFEKEVKETNSNFPLQNLIGTTIENSNSRSDVPVILIQAIARYVGWLNNEGVPEHLKIERGGESIKDIKRSFTVLVQALKSSGYRVESVTINQLDDRLVGKVYEYLLSDKQFGNRTFNKYFGFYTSFLKWYSQEYEVPVSNRFEKVKRKKLNYNPQTITKTEFVALLAQITVKNGIRKYNSKAKPRRNMYRPWLVIAFLLALATGRRREEIIKMIFDDIVEEGNVLRYIKVEDFKVNRIQGRNTDSEKKYVYVPITKSLKELLINLGYEKYKNSDRYILAPEITSKRTRVISDDLSRGFAHYYGQLNTGRKLSFGCLRKTYITSLSSFLGDNARIITGHSGSKVIEDHYIDKQKIAQTAQGFDVFNEEESRNVELGKARSKSVQRKKEMGVSK